MQSDAVEMPSGIGRDARPMPGGKTRLRSVGDLDGRTRSYRRYHAIVAAVLSDLGGAENTTETVRQLITRFALLAVQLEAAEAAALSGEEIDLDTFARVSGHLRRLAETLGLARRSKPVESLEEYLARRQAQPDLPEDEGAADEVEADIGDERHGQADNEGQADDGAQP